MPYLKWDRSIWGSTHLYLRFPGTILVTFLCGAFPGILAEAGCMLLLYAFEASRSGFDYLIFTIPIYNLLNTAVVALIIDAFIRRSAYRQKWNFLLLLPLIVLADTLLSTVIPALDALCDTGMLEADALETLRSFPEQLSESFELGGFLNRARGILLRYGLTLAVALAIYHLIPAKLRKSILGSRWMQEPLPPKLLAQIGKTKSRHSLKTRITVLVVIAIVLSAGIITIINASNTAMVSAYDQTTKLINAGTFTGSVIAPENAREYLEKGAEAEGYEETAALLQSYVDSTANLSRLYVLRIAEEGITVIFNASDDGQPPQGFGEALSDESLVAPFIESGLDWIEDYDGYEKRDGGNTVYVGIIPIANDDGVPLAYVVPEVRSASILLNVLFSILRIVIEFSGIFVALIAFGLWISRYYMIYPIASISSRADAISGNLDDLGSLDGNIRELEALDIRTEDETETLYKAVCRMAQTASGRLKGMQSLFEGTVKSLVNAIDAKDVYTHGHSSRVAM